MMSGTKTLFNAREGLRNWIALPPGKCIHELFAMQAEKTPESIAIVCGAELLTYDELDHRSNQLAHYLLSRGVGPETIVGLCVERSPEMVVGLLGITKAGAAYLPLDPGYPRERLGFMLTDSGASVVVTQEALRAKLSSEAGDLICLDTEWHSIKTEKTRAPAVIV